MVPTCCSTFSSPRAASSRCRSRSSATRSPGVIEHLDLILVRRGERIVVEILIHLEGAIASGGLLEQSLTTLSVTADATNIPSGVEVSIDGLEIGTAVHASDVKLPDGVELAGDPEQLVLHIVAAPTAEQMEAEGAGEATEAAAGEAEAAEGERRRRRRRGSGRGRLRRAGRGVALPLFTVSKETTP